MIQLTTHETTASLEIAFSGSLTKSEVKAAFDHVQPVLQQSKAIVLNLAGVTDLDAMGFQMLVYWRVHAAARRRPLKIVNHSAQVLAALSLYGSATTGTRS